MIIFLFLTILIYCTPKKTDSTQQSNLTTEQSLSAATTDTLYMACSVKEDSQSYSRFYQIYTEAFRRIGYDIELVFFPPERSLIEANSGRYVGETGRIYNLNENDEYPNLIRIEEKIINLNIYAYLTDKDRTIHTWEDLSDTELIIGFRKGIKLIERHVTAHVDSDKLYPARDSRQGFEALLGGIIDVYVAPELWDPSLLENSMVDYSQIEVATHIIHEISLYPYIHKNYGFLIEDLTREIRNILKENQG